MALLERWTRRTNESRGNQDENRWENKSDIKSIKEKMGSSTKLIWIDLHTIPRLSFIDYSHMNLIEIYENINEIKKQSTKIMNSASGNLHTNFSIIFIWI